MPSLLLSVLALTAPAYGAVHESLAALPYGWRALNKHVPDSTQVKLQVALQFQNLDSLEAQLAYVSTPGSPGYGKYIDLGETVARYWPSRQAQDSVTAWLNSNGISNVHSDGSNVHFTTTVGRANKLLDTNFALYTDGNSVKLRTTQYSVPDYLGNAVDLIAPTTYFGDSQAQFKLERLEASKTVQAPSKRQVVQTSCETTIQYPISANQTEAFTLLSPQCLKELYNTTGYSADPNSGSTVAFGSFLNQSASYSDLAQFEQVFGIPSQNFSVKALINGGIDNQNVSTEQDGEANLDVQNIIGLVDGLPVYEYITGGLPPFVPDLLEPNASTESNEPYLQYYQYLLSQPNSNLPYVITNSYGDHENTVPEYYAKRVCNMIGMMGLRGRTILESAGDEGVGAVCLTNDGTNRPEFTPQFPGTCPYLTAVGGTQFINPENAWNGSSGGFSNYFPTAFYQKKAINTYLNNYISASTKEYYSSNQYTNFSGRGFPDISAHSLWPDFLTVIAGQATPNGGTSASSPVVAAIFALINDARLRAGQPALGFANPFLYEVAAGTSSIYDITIGGSLGCAGVDLQTGATIPGAGIIPYASWNATVGWDPVTGLGTPNFGNMVELAKSVANHHGKGGWGNGGQGHGKGGGNGGW